MAGELAFGDLVVVHGTFKVVGKRDDGGIYRQLVHLKAVDCTILEKNEAPGAPESA